MGEGRQPAKLRRLREQPEALPAAEVVQLLQSLSRSDRVAVPYGKLRCIKATIGQIFTHEKKRTVG